jgi:hypothetical protein
LTWLVPIADAISQGRTARVEGKRPGRPPAALTLQDMTVETHNAKLGSEPLDLRNLIETIPALIVCALPNGFAEFANHAYQEYPGGSSSV